MSIHESQSADFFLWMQSFPFFAKTDIKIHEYSEHPFAKLTIKWRKQLVALDLDVDFQKKGKYLTPKEWAAILESRDENTVVVDVRNGCEWDVGHFEGSKRPDYASFREFPKYIAELKKKYDPDKTKFLMFCTGGIRCEFFSPMMIEAGLKNIYQLKGGVIKYGLEQGAKYWKGNLFVFDDRLVVPISEEKTDVISHCHFCDEKIDTYYNCANMDCNDLFLSCPSCIEKKQGCCSDICQEMPVRRAFSKAEKPKPFRKLPFEEKKRLRSKL
ncbi:MAG: rhodanese domain-containing protein, partial [Simkaniaceae bacterium]|nr:rhodanese domain-containing protein [Simkaniaceae bacterium]